jgi:hypothetical protein
VPSQISPLPRLCAIGIPNKWETPAAAATHLHAPILQLHRLMDAGALVGMLRVAPNATRLSRRERGSEELVMSSDIASRSETTA